MLNTSKLEMAFDYIGADLASKEAHVEVLVVGGGSLLLLGIIARPTQDVDVVAIRGESGFVRIEAFPKVLSDSISRVQRLLELEDGWMNIAARSVMDQGLPSGFEERLSVREYDGLVVHLLGRLDLIYLKLHAAVDRGDPKGKHAQDLEKLEPTIEELQFASKWAMTHDPSQGFRSILCCVLQSWGVNDADDWLPKGI